MLCRLSYVAFDILRVRKNNQETVRSHKHTQKRQYTFQCFILQFQSDDDKKSVLALARVCVCAYTSALAHLSVCVCVR